MSRLWKIRLGAGALWGATLVGSLNPLLRLTSTTPLFLTGSWIPIISRQLINGILLSTSASLLQALSAWWLYAHLKDGQAERPVLLSLICSAVGSWCVIPLVGLLALGLPTTAAQVDSITLNGIDVAVGTMGIPFLLFAGLSGIAGSLGAFFLSIALARQSRLPRWALVVYAISVPLEDFTPAISMAVEIGIVLLFLLAAGALLMALWREQIHVGESSLLSQPS